MNTHRLLVLALVLGLLLPTAAAAAPLAGPCVPGATYDSACDANQDGHITVTDIQLTAGHWNQNGTFVSDNNHNHLGQTWTGSNNPLKIQGAFAAPDYTPLLLSNSTGHGLTVTSAAIDGIYVGTVGAYGMVVNAAAQDGVYVGAAGTPSTATASTASNGFEVAGAQGDGLYVGRADHNGVTVNSTGSDGVHVSSTGYDGVYVGSAGFMGVDVILATSDGVRVTSTGGDGLHVTSANFNGLLVGTAGYTGVYADTTQASGQWGFYTPDAIHGSNVLMHSLSLVAQVTGPDSLTPGDIVAVAGVADPLPGSTVHTPLVRLAGGSFTNVVGVVESHLALTEQPSHPQTTEGETPTETPVSELRSVDGAAQPGDYVAITVMGAAQVKVASATPIAAGQRLTVAANGRARPLGTLKVQLAGDAGTADLPEGAPVIGVAMESAKDGLVWVLINPQ